MLSRAEFLLLTAAAALLGLTAIGLSLPQPVIGQFGIGYGVQLDHFVLIEALQGLIYVAAVIIVLRTGPPPRAFWLIIGAAILLRLLVLVFPPFLSNDMYRYIWDGWVQAAGINPYRYIPADPHLAFLRDTVVYPNINRATYAPTIYPPFAEIFFLITTKIARLLSLPPVFAMKLFMVGAEGIGIWAMLRLLRQAGLPRGRIIIYAWNPVPIWEFAGNGHVDAIAIGLIALALLAASYARSGLAAAALAGAVLTKFLPLVLLPAVWRRWDWRFAAVFAALIALLYAPYLSAGRHVLGFLGGYGAQEGIDTGTGIFLLSLLAHLLPLPAYAAKIYLALLAILLASAGAIIVFFTPAAAMPRERVQKIASHATWLGCILMAGLAPHYPWYYCWLLIPACIVPWPSSLYLVTLSFILYLNPIHTKLFWPAFLYGPFFALALRDVWFGKMPGFRNPEITEGAK